MNVKMIKSKGEALLRASLTMFFVSMFFVVGHAFATSLTIEGIPTLEIKQDGDNWKLVGSYEIVNKGDETAQNVFPNLTFGSWQWAGELKTLPMKEKAVWKLDQSLPRDKLNCQPGDMCAGLSLPDRGTFPLFVRLHYEDTNSYQFTASSVLSVPVGELTGEALVASRAKPLIGKLEISGDGNSFDAELELRNTAQVSKKVSIAYFTSREIQVITRPQVVELAAGAVQKSHAELKNFAGLVGSSYAVYAVVQWEEFGVRNSLIAAQVAKIAKPLHSNQLVAVLAGVIIVSLLLIYVFVFRKPGRK